MRNRVENRETKKNTFRSKQRTWNIERAASQKMASKCLESANLVGGNVKTASSYSFLWSRVPVGCCCLIRANVINICRTACFA